MKSMNRKKAQQRMMRQQRHWLQLTGKIYLNEMENMFIHGIFMGADIFLSIKMVYIYAIWLTGLIERRCTQSEMERKLCTSFIVR